MLLLMRNIDVTLMANFSHKKDTNQKFNSLHPFSSTLKCNGPNVYSELAP